MNSPSWTISIDAGGTFTDAIGQSSTSNVVLAKVASTPKDPALALTASVAQLAEAGVDLSRVSLVCHGTTVATNAVLTGRLARVCLITTSGFRDVLAYRNGSRPQVYSLTPTKPTELVERENRLEAEERIDAHGRIHTALTEAEIERLIGEVARRKPDAVAISLLFSYLNDIHEKTLGDAVRAAFPDLPITLSSEVSREFREYPRTATTVVNAALRPVIGGYLQRAGGLLLQAGTTSPLVVMQSNGGCVPAERAATQAHRLILSGPAGGVTGLLAGAQTHQLTNVISLDMGGTSTDICLVRDGVIPFSTTQDVDGHQILAPTVDIHTIGAGGGSIAWRDRTGRLRVGPQSAGASPGPACYGRGGVEPTVSDAHAVLSTLGATELAGNLELDRDAAIAAVDRVAEDLGATVEDTAEAIVAISLAHMTQGVRKVSVARGIDPRSFTLFAFGGAGPMYAGLLLQHLQLRSVVVPERPGLYSAEGLLAAGLAVDDSQTVLARFDTADLNTFARWFADHAEQLSARIRSDGVASENIDIAASVDCRYLGQGFELSVSLPGFGADALAKLAEAFHARHKELYGYASPDEPVEMVTLRISARGRFPHAQSPSASVADHAPPPQAFLGRRRVRIPGCGSHDTPIINRDALTAGSRFTGPAIISQMDTTTVVLPGQTVRVAANRDLLIGAAND